jgi:hypothetical protein
MRPAAFGGPGTTGRSTTSVIRDFSTGGPHETPDLERIDPATAERLIGQLDGNTGVTDL